MSTLDVIVAAAIGISRRADVLEAARVFLEQVLPVALTPQAREPVADIVSGPALDRALGISARTRSRFIDQGMPVESDAPRRFSAPACKAWLASRAKAPNPKDDIGGIAARNGLRAVR